MDIRIPEPRQLLDKLGEQLRKGLWPYTPDPAPVGLFEIGAPPRDTPLIVEGNSRHALGRLRRALLPIGGRVLVVDTGGRSLYTALADGTLKRETVVAAVEDFTSTGENPASNLLAALLPYPIYQTWNEEELSATGIAVGPASPEHLPAFLARGQILTEDMKIYLLPLRERLHLAMAHGGFLLLVAALSLFFISIEVFGVGVVLILAAALGAASLLPHLYKPSWHWPWMPTVVFALLFGIIAALPSAIIEVEIGKLTLLIIGATTVGGWIASLCDDYLDSPSPEIGWSGTQRKIRP